MPTSEEQVLITIKAVDNASEIVRNIKSTIDSLAKSVSKTTADLGKSLTSPVKTSTTELDNVLQQTSYRMTGFGEASNLAGSKANMTFKEAAATMESYHVGLNRVTNAMTGLFGTMGLFGMAHQSWVQSTQRQTNQVYLTMRRGTEQARDMYAEIMQIVMELPGDDTFMTTLLTQASGRDLTMTSQGIRELGDAIADYYVAATAKGQLTYETQRELTSYILTGETRMFTNSVLAAEIDLLKDKNTVTERATALQEALTRSGFEGMAHYETATNAMEEFKGHFQKAFADIGSAMLPVIQGLLSVYNAIDGLVGGGISASIIMLATSIAGLTTALGVIGFITPMVNEGITSLLLFGNVISNLRTGISNAGGVFNFLSNHVRDLVSSAQAMITPMEGVTAATSAQVMTETELGWAYAATNSGLMTQSGIVGYNTEAILANALAVSGLSERELALKITNDGLTASKFAETLALDVNTMALLSNASETIGLSEATLLNMAMESEWSTEKYLSTLLTNYDTIAKIDNSLATGENTVETNINLLSIIRNSSAKAYDTVVNGLRTASILLMGDAEARDTVIKNSNILTTLRGIGVKARNIVMDLWEAVALASVVDGQVVLNREKYAGILTRLQEFVATLNNAASKITEGMANLFNATTEGLSNKEKLLSIIRRGINIGLIIAETVALYGLAAAGAVVDAVFSPAILTLLAISGAILLVIGAVEELGKAFGWWTDLGSMWDSITSGIGRLWDAFMNSRPIQWLRDIIDTFSTFFSGTFKVINDFWSNLFGGGDMGAFDFVDSLINAFGNLYDVIAPIFNILFPIFPIIQGIAYWMEVFEQAWDEFVDSSEFIEMMEALGEVVTAFIEPFQELWNAFADVGAAIAEAFGIEEDNADSVKEDVNFIISGLKMIAGFIRDYVAPALKMMVQFAMPLLWAIRGITGIIGVFTGKDYFTNDTAIHSLNSGTTNYSTATNLTKTSNNLSNHNNNVIVNNNFNEGSIQPNTTLTREEFTKGMTEAFGYNKINGVGGIGYR